MRDLKKEFDEITLMKCFEIEVFDKRIKENDYVLFDITIDGNQLKASHIGLTTEEEQSKFIAFKTIDLDDCFSLDLQLQALYEKCSEAIINSDFFQLTN